MLLLGPTNRNQRACLFPITSNRCGIGNSYVTLSCTKPTAAGQRKVAHKFGGKARNDVIFSVSASSEAGLGAFGVRGIRATTARGGRRCGCPREARFSARRRREGTEGRGVRSRTATAEGGIESAPEGSGIPPEHHREIETRSRLPPEPRAAGSFVAHGSALVEETSPRRRAVQKRAVRLTAKVRTRFGVLRDGPMDATFHVSVGAVRPRRSRDGTSRVPARQTALQKGYANSGSMSPAREPSSNRTGTSSRTAPRRRRSR